MNKRRLTHRSGIEYHDPMQKRLQEYENAIEDNAIYPSGFVTWLFYLLDSGSDDKCTHCAYCPKKRVCRNHSQGYKTSVCIEGLKKTYEKQLKANQE